MGTSPINTSVGSTYKMGPCRPTAHHQCPNNLRIYTDGTAASAGYNPTTNPLLNKKPLPWGDVEDIKIPCGAVAAFAKNAMKGLLGKVDVSAPISLKQINNKISNHMS